MGVISYMKSKDYFLLNLSLYDPIKIDEHNYDVIKKFINDGEYLTFDCYCPECQENSTFKNHRLTYASPLPLATGSFGNPSFKTTKISDKFFYFTYNCSRNNNHIFNYYFQVKDNKLIKIGQSPSIADISIPEIKKYQKLLRNDYRDFSKAIGLYANGIGIGSFVYLRRIFENLIDEKKLQAVNENKLDGDLFSKSKMKEKIKMLENYLPDFLVVNRNVYGIISKGIHELSEEECLQLFPNVKLAIELILDEKLAEVEKKNKITQATKFISDTFGDLK